ncbi:hypothetical protein DPMN_164860 [Dreissena polymorpha]|uniref:Uncharacterized protein n=2 Tax=Dreissena polymorpha TaxID=45954 RepID=A0A9D4EVS0_DREPO|nr:hypothetical protein DPMN_164860 [Dreissena polymorpha]
MSQSLSSLTRLERLSIIENDDSHVLWEVLRVSSLTRLERLSIIEDDESHVLWEVLRVSSLTRLERLSIIEDDESHVLWEVLRGLNIKSLNLSGRWSLDLTMHHVESLSQSLSSLTQLETLSIQVNKESPGLWKALSGLSIKTLNLRYALRSLRVKHVESISQSLSSLIRMETLSIEVYDDSHVLWEALRGLNIKSLKQSGWCSGGLIVNHVVSLSQSLSSLTQLEKLSICVSEEMPGLWGALRSLNINKLSLSGCLRVNNVELLSNSLSSLTQLKTLSIIVEKDSPGLWEALRCLNIKNLGVEWFASE